MRICGAGTRGLSYAASSRSSCTSLSKMSPRSRTIAAFTFFSRRCVRYATLRTRSRWSRRRWMRPASTQCPDGARSTPAGTCLLQKRSHFRRRSGPAVPLAAAGALAPAARDGSAARDSAVAKASLAAALLAMFWYRTSSGSLTLGLGGSAWPDVGEVSGIGDTGGSGAAFRSDADAAFSVSAFASAGVAGATGAAGPGTGFFSVALGCGAPAAFAGAAAAVAATLPPVALFRDSRRSRAALAAALSLTLSSSRCSLTASRMPTANCARGVAGAPAGGRGLLSLARVQ
mmetsp:Transcript_35373/g.111282  ORF Transcript_35373/g.111282 Transcript_35373/m.111282 type:complete len:288 (+) Transcript_35373:215-1078(+)